MYIPGTSTRPLDTDPEAWARYNAEAYGIELPSEKPSHLQTKWLQLV
jgi:hypothetical protein